MKRVDHECIVLAHHGGTMGWSVEFRIKMTTLILEYDRGSMVVIKDPRWQGRSLGRARKVGSLPR